MSIFASFILLIMGITLGPSLAIYLAYDCKSYYRILENRFWDNFQYYTIGALCILVPLLLLVFTTVGEFK